VLPFAALLRACIVAVLHKTGLETPTSRLSNAQVVDAILVDHSVEGAPELGMDRIADVFPYPLDPFQGDCIEAALSGTSVVVCAPTGAGKTAIAVGAIVAAMARGRRVVYTTPLKALSNQKLFELQVRPARSHLLRHNRVVH
jgi:superfamily II RNA helicase